MMDSQEPDFMTIRPRGSVGFYVLVTWPDGFETQVHGFADESEVKVWIAENGPKWREWAPQRNRDVAR